MPITKRFSEKVIELVNQYKEDNFFIYLAHSLPHIPLYASDDFLGKSKRGLYGDVIEEIDFGVGQILNQLKKQEEYWHAILDLLLVRLLEK